MVEYPVVHIQMDCKGTIPENLERVPSPDAFSGLLSQMNDRPRDRRQLKIQGILIHLEVFPGMHDDPFLVFKSVACRGVVLMQGADCGLSASILFRQGDSEINRTVRATVDHKNA